MSEILMKAEKMTDDIFLIGKTSRKSSKGSNQSAKRGFNMGPKTAGKGKKRQRLARSLDVKLEVIRRMDNGQAPCKVARDLRLPSSTVRYMYKRKDEYLEMGKTVSKHSEVKIILKRSVAMEKMERLLSAWIVDSEKKGAPLSISRVRLKARNLLNQLKSEMTPEGASKLKPFQATKGWFRRFKVRQGFNNSWVQGDKAVNKPVKASEGLPEELEKFILEEGYDHRLIFNADETNLYWKKLPDNGKGPAVDDKAAKDRTTLLLGANSSGDFKLKPLVVYKSENPRAMKHVLKSRLPVVWKSHRKAWITKQIYSEWFMDYFVSATQKYCEENDLTFKVLLLLNSSTAHDLDFASLCPNICVKFLPPKTTTVPYPMYHGAIARFRQNYLMYILEQMPQNSEFWSNYNILEAVKFIGKAWDLIGPGCLNEAWKDVLPSCVVEDYPERSAENDEIVSDIVGIAMEAGFHYATQEHVEELLKSHDEPLSNDDLELDAEEVREESVSSEGEDQSQFLLTMPVLRGICQTCHSLCEQIMANDPVQDRAGEVVRHLKATLEPYRAILYAKEKDEKLCSLGPFFKGHNGPSPCNNSNPETEVTAEESVPGPSIVKPKKKTSPRKVAKDDQ